VLQRPVAHVLDHVIVDHDIETGAVERQRYALDALDRDAGDVERARVTVGCRNRSAVRL
jgi:hypothetical protein